MKRQTEDRINLALNTLIGIVAGIFLIVLISAVSCTSESKPEPLTPFETYTESALKGEVVIIKPSAEIPEPLVWIHPAYNLKCGVGHVPYHIPELAGWGGKQIKVGFDEDRDGYLMEEGRWDSETGEVQVWSNLCIEIENGQILVVLVYDELIPGYHVYMGPDLNMNDQLEATEVVETREVIIP